MRFRRLVMTSFGLAVLSLSHLIDAETIVTNYQYDDLGRAKVIEASGKSTATYVYDLADNRTKKDLLVNLPSSTISISTLGIDNKASAGTSSYRLRNDGYIEIQQGVPFIYAGTTFYRGETSTLGRWLAPGFNANNFQVSATLANATGGSTCTNGFWGGWINAGYGVVWAMTASSGATARVRCTFILQIREAINPSFILGTANITLYAGPGTFAK